MRYSFRTSSQSAESDVLNIALEGDLIGGGEAQQLLQAVDEYIEQGSRRCTIDLASVRFMNSSGIGLLTTLLAKFRNKGGDAAILRPSEQLKKLLIITKLEAIFLVAEDENEAIQKLIIE